MISKKYFVPKMFGGAPARRGVLYSLMVLFLILSILGIQTTLLLVSQDFSRTPLIESEKAYRAFENTQNLVLRMDKNGYAKTILDMTFPFSTTVDQNAVIFSRKLVMAESYFESARNGINLMKVLIEDTNYGRFYSGKDINISLDDSISWTASGTTLRIVSNPFCYTYLVDLNYYSLTPSTIPSCTGVFDAQSVRKVTLSISPEGSASDYNLVQCVGISCTTESYDPLRSEPYFYLDLNNGGCSNCSLPLTHVGQHFIPSTPFTITISCSGPSCSSTPIVITQNDLNFTVIGDEAYVYTATQVDFNSEVREVLLEGIGVTVEYNDAKKSME